MTIEARKSSVIRKLELVNENWLLRSIEKLKAERPPRAHNKDEFEKLADTIVWEQSIKELLNDLR